MNLFHRNRHDRPDPPRPEDEEHEDLEILRRDVGESWAGAMFGDLRKDSAEGEIDQEIRERGGPGPAVD